MHVPPLRLNRSTRESFESRGRAWLERNTGQQPEGYLEFALGAMATRKLGPDDPEKVNRGAFCETQRNRLRYLVDELDTPGEPKYKGLDETELSSHFKLDTDPKAAKQKPSTARNRRAEDKKASLGGDEDEAQNKFEQSRLEQALQGAVERLLHCKLTRGKSKTKPFKGEGFPYDNPFAVRIEKSNGVLPDEYFEIVKEPCDLSKIKDNLQIGRYKSFQQFERDVRLIVSNSRLYHRDPSSKLYKATSVFQEEAEKILAQTKNKLSS